MTDATILIVDDEPAIVQLLHTVLKKEGFTRIERAGSAEEAIAACGRMRFDTIVLDVMLPGMSGFELLRRIRIGDTATPVILLTAKGSVEDKVAGLDQGANDYMTKPFQIEELLARIRAALRLRAPVSQARQPEEQWLESADLKLNESTREVMRGEASIELTPREFDLLLYLLKNKRQVLSREQMIEAVWGYDYYGDTNVVDVYIRYVRKKIDDGFEQPLIHTVRGVGYVLKDNV